MIVAAVVTFTLCPPATHVDIVAQSVFDCMREPLHPHMGAYFASALGFYELARKSCNPSLTVHPGQAGECEQRDTTSKPGKTNLHRRKTVDQHG